VTRVLVTGASGFVGRALCDTLLEAGYAVRAAVRSLDSPRGSQLMERIAVGDVVDADWKRALQGVDCIVHAAARVHVDESRSDANVHLQTNAYATKRLAGAAVEAGVGKFVYLSSIKVNGEGADRPYRADDEPLPQDPYADSKRLGEEYAFQAGTIGGMDVAVVRSPLVYGPGVRANFLRLMQWVDRGWPLPLGSVDNRRSLVSIWNLCDLLARVLVTPQATGSIWMVSDGEDLSTPELVRRVGKCVGRRVRLLKVPIPVLQVGGALLGRTRQISQLCGSLMVDMSRTRDELRWSPVVSVDEALARTCAWFVSEGRTRVP
jgi:nucleoside-diphosphate-sugar epimerase